MQKSRRAFLGSSLTGLAMYGFYNRFAGAQNQILKPLFLHVVVPNGFDNSYLFDARPLKFTQAGWIQNYSNKEPILVSDSLERKSYFSDAAKTLWDLHGDKFSVLNGVYQSSGFDGHDQNMNQLFSGNPFGGNYFLNAVESKSDGLNSVSVADSFPFSVVTNQENTLVVDFGTLKNLVDSVSGSVVSGASPVDELLTNHYASKASGLAEGQWKSALLSYTNGLASIPGFKSNLKRVNLSVGQEATRFEKALDSVSALLRSGLTQRVQLVISEQDLSEQGDFVMDAHDATSCAKYPTLSTLLAQRIGEVLKMLNQTPAFEGSSDSLLSQTTVLFSSEFARTMRQTGSPIDATGTDHNPNSGLCLVAGKGVKTGQILGETDAAALDESGQFTDLNAFHKSVDQNILNVMGKGYDYETGKSYVHPSESVVRKQVLNIDSVVNTLIEIGNLPKTLTRVTDERLDPTAAPLVKSLFI